MAAQRNTETGIRSRFAQRLITTFTVIFLAIGLIGSGLFMCCAPITTDSLSTMFSRSEDSAFTQEELTKAAQATRDYTVGSHDRDAVYQVMYEINLSSQADGRSKASIIGAPDLTFDSSNPSIAELEESFQYASERHVLSPEALTHLDDVYYVINAARVALITFTLLGIIGCIILAMTSGRRKLGTALFAAAMVVIGLFAALALWVIVDFNGFFTVLHSLFFAEGSWTFDVDSLLIRMYPTNFWIGMGAVWLATTVLGSLICFILGLSIKGKKKA